MLHSGTRVHKFHPPLSFLLGHFNLILYFLGWSFLRIGSVGRKINSINWACPKSIIKSHLEKPIVHAQNVTSDPKTNVVFSESRVGQARETEY